MCPNCRAFVTTSDKVCPYCEVRLGPPPRVRMNQGNILGGLIPQVRFTTVMILLINTALYVADALSAQPLLRAAGASFPWNAVIQLPDGGLALVGDSHQLWRLVTAGFLHGGIMHILMNSWVLFDLGAEVEQLYGTSRLIVFYFFSTVTGFLLSSTMGHQAVGSSAGIFGLIGAMLAFGVTDKSALGSSVKALYSRWLIFALVMSFIPGVDYYAHIGGVAGGFVAGYLASTPRARLMWKEPLIRGLAAASLALTAGAFAMMFYYMSHG
jgi:rhomboid protease GluP